MPYPSLFDLPERSLRPLRPRQSAAIEAIRQAVKDGHKRIVVQGPTGFGKTLLAAHLIASSLAKGNRPLFTCPAITLIDQTVKAFEREGIADIGVIQAKHERTDWRAAVQVASVQTLIRRPLPEAHFILIDEVHITFEKLNAILDSDAWKDKIVIGLSATPWTKGMGHRWTKLIIAATIQELIAEGFLSTFIIYAPADEKEPDLSGVRTVAGDFEEKGASAVMSNAVIVADVVKTWKEKADNQPTFLFAVDRAHAKSLQEEFERGGIPCGYIDAFTERDKRREIFGMMRRGEFRIIASVGCLTTGVDEDVRVIVDAAPTKSEIRHVQKIGRGLRTADGKERLLILDHAGNTLRLGMVTDIHHDHLDTHKPGERGEAYAQDRPAPKPHKCQNCHALIPAGRRNCPGCGEAFKPSRSSVHARDGELVLMSPDDPREKQKAAKAPENKQQWYSEFLGLAKERGHSEGWAAHRFREKFKEWPNRLAKTPTMPGAKVLSFDKHCRIRYAKSRQRQVSSQPAAEPYSGEF